MATTRSPSHEREHRLPRADGDSRRDGSRFGGASARMCSAAMSHISVDSAPSFVLTPSG